MYEDNLYMYEQEQRTDLQNSTKQNSKMTVIPRQKIGNHRCLTSYVGAVSNETRGKWFHFLMQDGGRWRRP